MSGDVEEESPQSSWMGAQGRHPAPEPREALGPKPGPTQRLGVQDLGKGLQFDGPCRSTRSSFGQVPPRLLRAGHWGEEPWGLLHV